MLSPTSITVVSRVVCNHLSPLFFQEHYPKFKGPSAHSPVTLWSEAPWLCSGGQSRWCSRPQARARAGPSSARNSAQPQAIPTLPMILCTSVLWFWGSTLQHTYTQALTYPHLNPSPGRCPRRPHTSLSVTQPRASRVCGPKGQHCTDSRAPSRICPPPREPQGDGVQERIPTWQHASLCVK